MIVHMVHDETVGDKRFYMAAWYDRDGTVSSAVRLDLTSLGQCSSGSSRLCRAALSESVGAHCVIQSGYASY